MLEHRYVSELHEVFENRFQKLYPKKRLLAVHLDGFSHTVFFDNGKSSNEIEVDKYSGCMPEGNWSNEAKKLFVGFSHHSYQGNAIEYIFVDINER